MPNELTRQGDLIPVGINIEKSAVDLNPLGEGAFFLLTFFERRCLKYIKPMSLIQMHTSRRPIS